MSYNDDDEIKIGDLSEDEDAEIDPILSDPILDDDMVHDDDDLDTSEGFAGIDGSEY